MNWQMTSKILKLALPAWLMATALLGCGGGGGSGLIPPPLPVLATSYDNKNNINFAQPQVTGVTNAVAASLTLGDFSQTGEYSAFVAVQQQAGLPLAAFYKKNGSSWAEIGGLITGDKTVCNEVRQAITADFNKDSKPDVYVVCGGNVKQVFFMSQGSGYVRQESPFTLTNSWGATAGDIDGDGDVDLVLTDNGLTYAYLNDGTKQGAASFAATATAGRVPTAATGASPANVNFPTLHRKVFLLPRTGGYPDLLIGGDGATNNRAMIVLKNQFASGQPGYFYANSDVTSTFNSFEEFPLNNISFKPFDVVETTRFLYVLAKNADVSAAANATSLVVLRYELPTNNSPATSIINLTGADGTNGADPVVYSQTSMPGDGFVSQIKPASGKLVAYDAACASLADRCGFNATAP